MKHITTLVEFSIAYLAGLYEEATECREEAESLSEWKFWNDRATELRKDMALADH